MKNKLIALLVVFNVAFGFSQTDTTAVQTTVPRAADSTSQLLPHKMMLTQRILWGEKGLMRHFDSFKLTQENRDKELEIREKMISAHQLLGSATLVGLTGECVVGIMLYDGKNVRGLHQGLAAATNVCYFSTAALEFFSPPRLKDRDPGWSRAKIHKTLSIVHFTGMIATNVLAGMAENNRSLIKYHRAAAITTFASYLAATMVIKL